MYSDNEIWKDVCGYEGLYRVSSYGNIVSLDREVLAKDGRLLQIKGRLLSQNSDGGRGYLKVGLSKNGKTTTIRVHAIVAEAFLENKSECINHIDGNKRNNHVSNLEWTTLSHNNSHAIEAGLNIIKKKVKAISPTREEYYYESQSECSKDTGVSASYISGCLSGKYAEAKGWQFQRL